MQSFHPLALLFGGAFLINTIPHLVSGLQGRPFQTPFAKPPGQGLSSATVNVLWGSFNLALAYLLLIRVGHLDLHSLRQVAIVGAGIVLLSLLTARHFGRFHGGNTPGAS